MGKSDGAIDLTVSMNQEIYFNELSLEKRPDDRAVLQNFKSVHSKLKEKGFTVCRADRNTLSVLLDYMPAISGVHPGTIKNLVLSVFRAPYEKEVMTDEEEDAFLTAEYQYQGKSATGLQWAFVYDTMALSLLTDKEWDTPSVSLRNREDGSEQPVHHAATEQNIISQEQWIESLKDIELVKIAIDPADKEFHVREDHGTDKLKEFWKKIRKNDYIVSCINSLEFDKRAKTLIRKFHSNGIVELTLYWEDAGYGMAVQTTGRNYRETEKIAEILTEEYSK